MKKIICIALSLMILSLTSMVAFAVNNNPVLVYNGETQQFATEDGTNDIFPALKSVIPGQTYTQNITVKNKSSNQVNVKLYVRSNGADEASKSFLSQLDLSVKVKDGEKLFETVQDETAEESEWVCLGLFKSGANVDLEVTLSVPVELDNSYQGATGNLGFEFKAEEYPIEVAKTGDTSNLILYFVLLIISVGVIAGVVIAAKKSNNKENDNKQEN